MHAIKKFKLFIASDISTPIGSEILSITDNDTSLLWKQWIISNPTILSDKYLLVVENGDYNSPTYIQISEIRLNGYIPLNYYIKDSAISGGSVKSWNKYQYPDLTKEEFINYTLNFGIVGIYYIIFGRDFHRCSTIHNEFINHIVLPSF